MQRFEDLTRGGQVRRMRRLAETALTAYDLGEVHLTPLMHFFNTTFRIDTYPHSSEASQEDPAAYKGERYVIRIHRPGSHYLFDIGVAFSTLLARPDYPALHQSFLEGYRRVRPFSGDHETLIDTFIAARLMCHVLWLAAHVDAPSYGQRAIRRIEYELGELQSFLNG